MEDPDPEPGPGPTGAASAGRPEPPDPPDPPERPDPGSPGDGDGYEASRTQRGAALVVAGGLVVLIAGTVMSLAAGGCISPRSEPHLGYSCAGVLAEPWFGLVALVTVAAAALGSVLALRDLSSGWT